MLLAVRRRGVSVSELDYGKLNGLVPVIVQDISCGQPLMLGFASREAVEKTLSTGYAHFYSRSRKRLWMKGETTGNTIEVYAVIADCDLDSLVYIGRPSGPVCHTGAASCFHSIIATGRLNEAAWRIIVESLSKATVKNGVLYSPITTSTPPLGAHELGVIALWLVLNAQNLLSSYELVLAPTSQPHLPVLVAQMMRKPLHTRIVEGKRFIALSSHVDDGIASWAQSVGVEAVVAAININGAGGSIGGFWLADVVVKSKELTICTRWGVCKKLVMEYD